MENTTSIRVKLGTLEAEVTGSEAFVAKHGVSLLEEYTRLAKSADASSAFLRKGNDAGGVPREESDQEAGDLFHVDGLTVRVLSDIPGGPRAEQQVNAALLYMLAIEGGGAQEGRFSSIRALCKEHGIGLSHFAGNIQKEKSLFIVSETGTGKDPVVRLTKPGRTRAKQLAGQLQSA